MIIAMFNGWYFLWLLLAAGATLGLCMLFDGKKFQSDLKDLLRTKIHSK